MKNEYNPDLMVSELLAEYATLREEILKRMEFQHQLISLTLIIAGTILSIGLQSESPISPLLVYPLIAVFLAIGWKHHNTRISTIGQYIRDNIEKKLTHVNWETYFNYKVDKEQPKIKGATQRMLSAYGIFVGTQIATFLLSLLRSDFTTLSGLEIALLVANVAAIAISVRILVR